MSTPSVVVFDIDGTLMDHAAAARSGLEAWVSGLGRPMTDALAAAWRTAEQRHFNAWRDGEISFTEQRRRRLRDVLPLLGQPVGDDDELDEVFTSYLRAYEAAWQPYPDVGECLATLQQQGRRLAVLSNGSDEQQRKKLAMIGVAGYFSDVFTAESLGVGKPHREAYDLTAQALGSQRPSACSSVTTTRWTFWHPVRRAGGPSIWTGPANSERRRPSSRSATSPPCLPDKRPVLPRPARGEDVAGPQGPCPGRAVVS